MKDPNDLQAAIDQRLTDALAAANYRLTLNTQRQNAKVKLENSLTISTNGGTFRISPELISFVATLLGVGRSDAILLDVNGNPIEITDLKLFQEQLLDTYYEAMNDYTVTVKTLNRSRTTKAVVGEV